MPGGDLCTFSDITSLEGSLKADITFNKDHTVFKGHFPDHPVVPGVCLVRIILDLIRQVQHQKYFLLEASNIKFLNIIDPLENNTVSISIQQKPVDKNSISVKADFFDDHHVFCRFKGILAVSFPGA